MPKHHPDLEVLKFVVAYDDGTEIEVPVKDQDEIHCTIPEGTNYTMSIHFLVLNNTLKDLKYKQEVRKASFVVRRREKKLGESFEPSETPYIVSFDPETTPSGMMFRGTFDCSSIYYANGEEMFTAPWKLTISQKS